MIQNDQELKTTWERIAKFQNWLLQMRQTSKPQEFEQMASGYRLEGESLSPPPQNPLGLEPAWVCQPCL